MRDLIYTTKTALDGPWLLNTDSLKEFDAILAAGWAKFEKRRKSLLKAEADNLRKKYQHIEKEHKKEVQKEINAQREHSFYSKSNKLLYIYYPDGSTFKCESFDDAFKERSIIHKRPNGFGIQYLCGDINCQIKTEDLPLKLVIEILPEDAPEARELFTEVCNWAGDIRRHSIGQWIWGKLAEYRIMVLVFIFILISLLYILSQNSNLASIRSQLNLLSKQGITETNVVEVVTYLVQLQTTKPTITPWFITAVLGFIYAFIALTFYPKVALGIGKGKDMLLLWKIWQVIIVGIPSIFLLDIVWPQATDLLKSLLSLIP